MTNREWRLVERTFIRALQTMARTCERTGRTPQEVADFMIHDRETAMELRARTDLWLAREGQQLASAAHSAGAQSEGV